MENLSYKNLLHHHYYGWTMDCVKLVAQETGMPKQSQKHPYDHNIIKDINCEYRLYIYQLTERCLVPETTI